MYHRKRGDLGASLVLFLFMLGAVFFFSTQLSPSEGPGITAAVVTAPEIGSDNESSEDFFEQGAGSEGGADDDEGALDSEESDVESSLDPIEDQTEEESTEEGVDEELEGSEEGSGVEEGAGILGFGGGGVGVLASASIAGAVFEDVNGDGVFDAAESGIENITVRVWNDTDGDGAINATVDVVLSTVLSNETGNYTFALNTGDNYSVDISADFNRELVNYKNTTSKTSYLSDLSGDDLDVDFGLKSLSASLGLVDSSQKYTTDTNGLNLGYTVAENFGMAVANIGDLDGDGITDFAVSASGDETTGSNEGVIHIMFMNVNGSVNRSVLIGNETNGFSAPTIEDNDFFGTSIVSLGDLDGDGIVDLAVGAEADEVSDSNDGAVYILFMNANGSVSSNQVIGDSSNGFAPDNLTNADGFGYSLANLGDLNGDGVVDLAVGADYEEADGGTSNEGGLYILFMNSNGSVNSTEFIAENLNGFVPDNLDSNDFFGSSVDNIGDLDGDGVIDLAVGARGDENENSSSGAVYILFMETNGSVKNNTKIASGLNGFYPDGGALLSSDNFGSAVANLGDLDNDGINDLVVGADRDENEDSSEGAIYILFLNGDGSVKSNQKISDGLGEFNPGPDLYGLELNDFFGVSIDNAGDLNGDGITDLIVGANQDETGAATLSSGGFYVLYLAQDVACGDAISSSVNLTENLSSTGGACLTVNASNVVIDGSGFSMTGNASSDSIGINVSGFENVTIQNFAGITNFSIGVNSDNGTTGLLVQNSSIETANLSDAYAVYSVMDTNLRVEGNNITTYGNDSFAVYLIDSNGSNVSQNDIVTEDANGVFVDGEAYHNLISMNNVSLSNVTATSSLNNTGVYVDGDANNVTFNRINNSGSAQEGIVFFENNSWIEGNIFEGVEDQSIGIYGSNFTNVTVENNSILTSDAKGISVTGGSNSTISNNTITTVESGSAGIQLVSTVESHFYNNHITVGDSNGINIREENTLNTFEENIITLSGASETRGAFRFADEASTENNTLLNNNMTSNDLGIYDLEESSANYFVYNNSSFGQILWFNFSSGSFSRDMDLDLNGNTFDMEFGVKLDNNSISVNASLISVNPNLNETVNVSIYGLDEFENPLALRDSYYCSDCLDLHNTTIDSESFDYHFQAGYPGNFSVVNNSAGPVILQHVLNTTTLGNYSADPQTSWLNISDNDSLFVDVHWEIYENSVFQNSGIFYQVEVGEFKNVANRSALLSDVGDNVTVGLLVSDGEFSSDWINDSLVVRDFTAGDVITEDVTFTNDVDCHGDCLFVGRDGITINMAGYALIGNGSGIGINISDYSNVSILNGHVSNYSIDIYADPSEGIVLNQTNVSAADTGILFEEINESTITEGYITNNSVGVNLSDSHNNDVYNNYFNNTINAVDEEDDNNWNTSYSCSTKHRNIAFGNCTGGNFWSDYEGNDTDDDYVGNTSVPHNSSGNINGSGEGDNYPLLVCIESWSCGDWSGCLDNIQTRSCTDLNLCGSTATQPDLSQSCSGSSSSDDDSSSSDSSTFRDLDPATQEAIKDLISDAIADGKIASLKQLRNALRSGKVSLSTIAKKASEGEGSGAGAASGVSSDLGGLEGSSGSGGGTSGKKSRTLLGLTLVNDLEDLSLELQPRLEQNLESLSIDADLAVVEGKIKEKLSFEGDLSEEKVEEELRRFALLDEQNVLPLINRKSSTFFTSSTAGASDSLLTGAVVGLSAEEERELEERLAKSLSGIVATSEVVEGALLEVHLEDEESLVVEPGETLNTDLGLLGGISLEGREITLSLETEGEAVAQQKVVLPASDLGANLDLYQDERFFDLYVVLPEVNAEYSLEHEYYIEVDVRQQSDTLLAQFFPIKYAFVNSAQRLFKGNDLLYLETFGPYSIAEDEQYLLAQQFAYDAERYSEGLQEIHVRVYQDGLLVNEDIFVEDFVSE